MILKHHSFWKPSAQGNIVSREVIKNSIADYSQLNRVATYLKYMIELWSAGESSNGRTADSGSVNLGSNPSSPAKSVNRQNFLFRGCVFSYRHRDEEFMCPVSKL